MTDRQKKAVEQWRQRCQESLFFGKNWEFKKWEIEMVGDKVAVFFETGMVGDEGTLAAVFARDAGQIFIGPRGGIYYYGRGCRRQALKRYEGPLTVTLSWGK